MPCLSGIGLLCKMMNKKIYKDIPVISKHISTTIFNQVTHFSFFFFFLCIFSKIGTCDYYIGWVLFAVMSSHDSKSMVYKCLSKGAVDFLVKPIRKNELKNLWQHVWRKYQIVSFSLSILLNHEQLFNFKIKILFSFIMSYVIKQFFFYIFFFLLFISQMVLVGVKVVYGMKNLWNQEL